MTITIERGCVYAYRVYHVGTSINLREVEGLLKERDFSYISLRRSPRLFQFQDRPLCIALASWQLKVGEKVYETNVSALLFAFGSLSVRFNILLPEATPWRDLLALSYFLEHDKTIQTETESRIVDLEASLASVTQNYRLWEQYEDYVVFNIQRASGLKELLRDNFMGSHVTSLILGEGPITFADQFNQSIQDNILQYGRDDLVLVHWNGALIYDIEDAEDIACTIEFVVSQLGELRFMDNFLEQQLEKLYQKISESKSTFWRNPYQDYARVAALQYLEVSSLVDRINNSFKVLGDFYYAIVYRKANDCLRIEDWRQSVDRKLANFLEYSKLFQNEVNDRRNLILEIVIVVLIAIEVLPLIFSWVH